MKRIIRALPVTLLVVLVAAPAAAQTYPCLAGSGTNCRGLIPDTEGFTSLQSTVTVVASGACTTMPVSYVTARVNVLHDWIGDVDIALTSPSATTATLKAGMTGLSSPEDDLHQLFVAPSLTGGTAAGAWTLRLRDLSYSGSGALDDWTLYLVCGAVPVVTITAPFSPASEEPLINGGFLVTRTVVTSSPLTVTLQYFGSATSGVDYTALPTTVTIPAGQASVAIPVVPIPDAVTEGIETVQATILDPSLYTIGSPSSAVVQIVDRATASIPTLGATATGLLALLLAVAGALLVRRRVA